MPEWDMLSLGVMGYGGWRFEEILPSSSTPPPRSSPSGGAAGLAAPLDWLRRWIGGAAGLAAPLDWRRRWIGCAAGLFPLHWRHTACRREEQWKGREEQWKGHVRVCYDYKSMLGL